MATVPSMRIHSHKTWLAMVNDAMGEGAPKWPGAGPKPGLCEAADELIRI